MAPPPCHRTLSFGIERLTLDSGRKGSSCGESAVSEIALVIRTDLAVRLTLSIVITQQRKSQLV
jgi:hypothetical protein